MQNTLPSGLCTSFLLIADLWQQLGGEFHKEECCQETVRLMFFEHYCSWRILHKTEFGLLDYPSEQRVVERIHILTISFSPNSPEGH